MQKQSGCCSASVFAADRRRIPLMFHGSKGSKFHAEQQHRRALEGCRQQPVGGEGARAHIGRDVGDPERPLEVAEVFEEGSLAMETVTRAVLQEAVLQEAVRREVGLPGREAVQLVDAAIETICEPLAAGGR